MNYYKKYFIFQGSWIFHRSCHISAPLDNHFCLRFGSLVVFWVLIGVVWFVGALLFFLQFFKFIINVVFIPCFVIVLHCIDIPHQILFLLFLLLSSLCLCFLLLLLFLFTFGLLLCFSDGFLSLPNFSFGFFLHFHLLFPLVEICDILA